MIYEYLLFNIAVVAGPLAMSFERNLRFVRKWKYAIPAVLIAAVPYWAWDIIVAGTHWTFNEAYVLPIRLAGLPVEEWMFFITVPFASLFVWEVVLHYIPDAASKKNTAVLAASGALPLAGIAALLSGIHYTGLALLSAGVVLPAALTRLSRSASGRALRWYAGFIAAATFVFNSYLTARPVVEYNETYITGLRLGTIPLEDFFYGAGLILLATTIYEILKPRSAHE